MPYKARQKQGEARKRRKAEYQVTNARAYNQSLRKRGMISLYVPDGDLKAQFINAKVRTPGVSGRELTYTAAYIELIDTFYRLSGWGMRQTTGTWKISGRRADWTLRYRALVSYAIASPRWR